MAVTRFVLHVDPTWRVTLTRDGQEVPGAQPRQLRDEWAHAFPLPPADEPTDAWLPGEDFKERLQGVTGDTLPPGESIVAFGRYLFLTLVGKSWWTAITEAKPTGLVELALCWAASEGSLHRLPWEMMWLERQPLLCQAAITRIVGSSKAARPELSGAPKVLFVLGSKLGDATMRPAAEVFVLLDRIERACVTLQTKVLRRPSVDLIQKAVKRFAPDIVHFVCHGDIKKDGQPYLTLYDDDARVEADAPKLLTALDVEGRGPSVVVLSACNSGVPLAAYQTGSLAAELVEGGIPIVVGMSGRIADSACLLFSRAFGEALLSNRPVIEAAAWGRRAALVGDAKRSTQSLEWTRPTVFIAPTVDATLTLGGVEKDRMRALVAQWSRRSDVRGLVLDARKPGVPPFCDRVEHLEAFERLFEDNTPAVLPIFESQGERLGKTRTLVELVRRAMRAGHIAVPILKTSTRGLPLYRDLEGFVRRLDRAIADTRTCYLVPPIETSALGALLQAGVAEASGSDIQAAIEQDALRLRDDVRQVIPYALRVDDFGENPHDAALAVAAARTAAGGERLAPHQASRVVFFLDAIHDIDPDSLGVITDELLGHNGLGNNPVVVSYSTAVAAKQLLDAAKERTGWLRPLELKRFSGDEEMLAYQRLLLNPFLKERVFDGDTEFKAWAFTRTAPPKLVAKCEEMLRRNIRGRPFVLMGEQLYSVVDNVRLAFDAPVLVEVADEDRLDEAMKALDG